MVKSVRVSTKQLLIERANSTIVIAVGVAAFLIAFSLVSSRALLSRRAYQAKVIGVQEKARDQLKANLDEVDDLKQAYESFISGPENIIAGSTTGTGERDGDNAKIVLDALPSKYDFPGLATSLEKILDERNYLIQSITGFDDEATQNPSTTGAGPAGATTVPTATPSASAATLQTSSSFNSQQKVGNAVEIPFEVGAKGSYQSLTDLLKVFQFSIRPLQVDKVSFHANEDSSVSLIVTGKSFYQPEKQLTIKEEVVK